jgi:CheY-like chemotaxis protein
LVVDDDRSSRTLLVGMLRRAGYDVNAAADGLEALQRVRETKPDVVLLDVLMPRMSGYEVCAAIKDDPVTQHCQVMLVTSLDGTPDKVEGLDIGADDYVCKPVRSDEFLAKVRALIRARRLLSELEQAKRALHEKNRELELKKTLAQSLVNDLRNPLAGLLGNFDLMEMGRRADQMKWIDRSRRAAKRMLGMVSNLTEVEAMESGRMQPQYERLDLAEMTQRVLDEIEPIATSRNVTLSCEELLTTRLGGDARMLQRMIDNLISNAVANSPDGGTVELRLRPCSEGAEWIVALPNSTVPASLRHRVFDKYAEPELQQAGVMANRGLSLSLCQLVAETHRGTIELRESDAGGDEYVVRLRGLVPQHSGEKRPELQSVASGA